MRDPVKGVNCAHGCFDLSSYLVVSESTRSWECPLCKKRVHFNVIVHLCVFYSVVDSVLRRTLRWIGTCWII